MGNLEGLATSVVAGALLYDYLGASGNAWIKTLELDALSRLAVSFDRCTIASFRGERLSARSDPLY